MLEMWKNILGKERYAYDIFTDLSKAFEKTDHDLMIALLVVHGFPQDALQYMGNYFVDDYKESWKFIIAGVPYSSILEPLLFNIFIKDLFLFVSNSH